MISHRRSGWQADNDTIFKDLGTQILKSTLEGYKTCLFAHGQSQSGKTYTLVGQESDPGLLPRLLEALFQQEAVLSGQLAVSASFYEIKDEQVRDILKQDFYSPGGLKVQWFPAVPQIMCSVHMISPPASFTCALPVSSILAYWCLFRCGHWQTAGGV